MYTIPADKLIGLGRVIREERDRKMEEARERRKQARAGQRGLHEQQRRATTEFELAGRQGHAEVWTDRRAGSQDQTRDRASSLGPPHYLFTPGLASKQKTFSERCHDCL